jgi:hypothetical protein
MRLSFPGNTGLVDGPLPGRGISDTCRAIDIPNGPVFMYSEPSTGGLRRMSDEIEREARLSEKIEEAASIIVRSRRMVAATGAGISKESGIPTFREPDGLWSRHRPEELATREAFLSDPKLVWGWYRERLRLAREVEPNPGHSTALPAHHTERRHPPQESGEQRDRRAPRVHRTLPLLRLRPPGAGMP